MFIGHFAVAMAAKRALPHVSLAVLVVAAQLADLLWPVFLAVGLEHVEITNNPNPFLTLQFISYPYSHSLLWLTAWGVLFGVLCRLTLGTRRVMWIVAALVLSHWVLDVATHRPDVPLLPAGPKIGFGLWNSPSLTVAVEGAMYIAGVWIYLQAAPAPHRWRFLAFVIVLAIAYGANLVSPAPPSVRAVYLSMLIVAPLLVWWSWWADRRQRRSS